MQTSKINQPAENHHIKKIIKLKYRMRFFQYKKLVRDKIVEQMVANNQLPRGVRELNDQEYIVELIRKLIEETEEMRQLLKETDDFSLLKEELADVLEVLDYLKPAIGTDEDELKSLMQKKTAKNGGFSERTYIKDVGVPPDNKWISYYLKNPEKYPEVPE